MGKVRNRFGGVGLFKGGLSCKRRLNSVIIEVITEINHSCNYILYISTMQTFMYTISALNRNVSTYLKTPKIK